MAQLPLDFQRPAEVTPETPRIWRVSELARTLRADIERAFPRMWVAGEVSNLRIHRVSGHAYFTLKDGSAQLRCVMWRDNVRRLRFQLEDGQDVIVQGRLTVYERDGDIQLSATQVELQGLGALEAAYRQLAERLRQEGLTSAERKRPLPAWPTTVGVVTSRDAAAFSDVLRTILRRDPRAHVILSSTAVQGNGAAAEIARAIARLEDRCDVILVVRGGGSVEDLWAFNEEVVARAIAGSRTPVVTGVGHETDTTIADLVADRAASTPTAAAELAVPVRAKVEHRFHALGTRLNRAMAGMVRTLAHRVLALRSRARDPKGLIHRRAQSIDDLTLRAERIISARIARARSRLHDVSRRVEQHAPKKNLERMTWRLGEQRARLEAALHTKLERQARCAAALELRLAQAAPHLDGRRAELARLEVRTTDGAFRRLDRARQRYAIAVGRLEALSPLAVLARGYAVVRDDTGRVVRAQTDVVPGDRLRIAVAAGEIAVIVEPSRSS